MLLSVGNLDRGTLNTIIHLEGLPLDLSGSGDSLGLDEEGARINQLHTL